MKFKSNKKINNFVLLIISLTSISFFSFVCYKKKNGIKIRLDNISFAAKAYFNYDGNRNINSQIYTDNVTPQKRYLALGFDDFRNSDFSMIIPLLKKYNATATFNRIEYNANPTKLDLWKINQVLSNGNELGDHTFFHCNYIYTDALCNGQNPDYIEGDQIPFPSNEQLRNDFGNGKNAFGYDLNSSIKEANYGYPLFSNNIPFDTTWDNLTDNQCQQLRNSFSIYQDKSGKLELLDKLSNKYLGTTGNSYGSWSLEKGVYTGGIFTGSKTSCNNEIWERIINITNLYYKDFYNPDFKFYTWSWPGDWRSPFYFENNGFYFYDTDDTTYYNYLAKFTSSITGEKRSFIDVIRGGVSYDS